MAVSSCHCHQLLELLPLLFPRSYVLVEVFGVIFCFGVARLSVGFQS